MSYSHSQPFTVGGMSGQGALHSPSLRTNALAGSSGLGVGGPLGESLSQSRSHYQPGYLMSAAPSSATSQSPRNDEIPIVQTKAKMSHVLSGGSAPEFGMDSMFETSRRRQRTALPDEDAPPTASINDIVNEVYDPGFRSKPQNSTDSPARSTLFRPGHSQTAPRSSTPAEGAPKPLYIVVFGYPLDKYSLTVEYFRSLGEATEPEANTEITNCFRIGYTDPAGAMRAIRKNGEVISGAWMIGVKWADPKQAEAMLGSSLARSSLPVSPPLEPAPSPDVTMSESASTRGFASAESQQMALIRQTPAVGTPLKLAPSASAFRKAGAGSAAPNGGGMVGAFGSQPGQAGVQATPSKGVIGQVTDLIFGW